MNPARGKVHIGALICAVLFIGVGTLFVVLAWGGHLKTKRVLSKGERATAKITDKKVSKSRVGTGKNRSAKLDHMIYYAFEKGETIKSHYSIPKDKWDAIEIGDPIEIAYDPADPQWNVPVEYASLNLSMAIVLSVFGLVPVLIGVLCLVGFIRALRGSDTEAQPE